MAEATKVGIIGCGNISDIYFQNLQKYETTEVVACADLFLERAREKAAKWNVPKACSPEELLSDPDVKIVVNLTIPIAHAEVSQMAVEAGKSSHCEKPLTITREDGKRLLATARDKGVRIGAAPDTFMGAGIQTCRELLDSGAIGEPVACTAFMVCHGHESWHPDPEFYYKLGGGPMFDMGPYYLTALVNLLGPVKRVTGSTRITFPERRITSEPKRGQVIKVDVPTHIAGVMDFQSGAIGTIIQSFDVWHHRLPCIEIYGTEGSMQVPDPNGFGGPVRIRKQGDSDWQDVEITRPYAENSRGIGVADMACAISSGRKHRASGDLAYHVLDLMHAFHDASDEGRHILVQSTCERPAPMPVSGENGKLD
ncbi:MAG: Gfo/Idh/MocA family oxidoreductase [Armatimonadetes bacterium]|nr:Gfo/Idh/MocA family oxidoreductase [Armatimonadota bacterium]